MHSWCANFRRSQVHIRPSYIDPNYYGHCVCGAAREAMVDYFCECKFETLDQNTWYTAVRETTNPIVRGFLAEQILIRHIAKHGLTYVNSSLTEMDHAFFDAIPMWQMDKTLCIYIPRSHRFTNIDCIIVHMNSKKCTVHFYPIQITLSRRHKDSEERFYLMSWNTFKEEFESAGFTVHSTFVWCYVP
jgi:hypothetical protein